MEEEISTFEEYLYVYQNLHTTAQELFDKVKRVVTADKEAFTIIKEKSEDTLSITIKMCGFKIKSVLVINSSREIGHINWYHLYFDENEQKDRGELVCEQFFDTKGLIYKDELKQHPLLFQMRGRFDSYLKKTFFQIFQAIDNKGNTGRN